jgi:hypothetical protein
MSARCQEAKTIEEKISIIYGVVTDNSGQYETNAIIISPSNEAGLGGAI